MELPDRDALGQFARQHHVHYEVDPEEAGEGDRRERVGLQVRLFATHDRSKLGAPGCPACVELLGELRSFAERLTRGSSAADRTELVPASPALYQSTEAPDADEVALTMRVRCATPEHRRPGSGEDLCLGEIRDRLAQLGVPRR
jgi:hypothetical protein